MVHAKGKGMYGPQTGEIATKVTLSEEVQDVELTASLNKLL